MNHNLAVEEIKQLILNAPIGKYIGDHGAQVFAEHADKEITIKPNEYLYHHGELENHFYIITSGKLSYVKENITKDKPARVLETLEQGDLIAELSFIDDTPHTTSCMAFSEATVICFQANDIRPLIIQEPRVMFDFMRAVIKRVHHTVSKISKQQLALSDYVSTAGRGQL
ncbi:MAG: cyclic nucleotide-binding domain-containing protein [Cocleimonas sp.]|nr:cyclic nucleotide-binding domain-containing protein [Cocleimonas sp.]